MALGIDPKVDYAFKFLFGNERNTQPLIHVLHAILNPAPEEQIVEVQILNPFNEKMALDDKLSILDVKARDQLGRQFNVEMQMLALPSLQQRVLYYWAKLYAGQLQAGQDYGLLRPTISVCFVDGEVFPAVPSHHMVFRLTDAAEGVALTDDLSIHFFELPKFNVAAEDVATPLEAWLYFLRHAEGMDPGSLPSTLDTTEIRQAMEALMVLAQIDIQKEIYEGRMKRLRDQETLIRAVADAQTALEDARAERDKARAERDKVRAERDKVRAEAEAARGDSLAKGALIGRIEFAQKLLRRAEIPLDELKAMPLDRLEALAAQLEREALG